MMDKPMILTRRKFFSFFGTGVVMLAKPGLLVPKVHEGNFLEAAIAAAANYKDRLINVHMSWNESAGVWQWWQIYPEGLGRTVRVLIPDPTDEQVAQSLGIPYAALKVTDLK